MIAAIDRRTGDSSDGAIIYEPTCFAHVRRGRHRFSRCTSVRGRGGQGVRVRYQRKALDALKQSTPGVTTAVCDVPSARTSANEVPPRHEFLVYGKTIEQINYQSYPFEPDGIQYAMSILDYLLIATFAAAALYTVYRLILGGLRSPGNEMSNDEARDGKHTSGDRVRVSLGARTGTPWQTRYPGEPIAARRAGNHGR